MGTWGLKNGPVEEAGMNLSPEERNRLESMFCMREMEDQRDRKESLSKNMDLEMPLTY